MQTDLPQFWTDEMVARFRDDVFSQHYSTAWQFDIFQKLFYISIEEEEDENNLKHPRKTMNISYSCNTFCRLLKDIPFYLILSTEADYYKDSAIGYVRLVDGKSIMEEPQAKIMTHVRQSLRLESRLDKMICEASYPPGRGKKITLRLDDSYRDMCTTARAVGIKFPIRQLEIDYCQGQPKEAWPMR